MGENGHQFIKSREECQTAGNILGGFVHKPLTAGGNRQKYCGTWDHNTWLQFNPQASGYLNGHAILQRADGFTWQVCKKTTDNVTLRDCNRTRHGPCIKHWTW